MNDEVAYKKMMRSANKVRIIDVGRCSEESKWKWFGKINKIYN